MKFVVENLTKNTPRLGILNDFHRLPNAKIETPSLFLYTMAGNVPHLPMEVLNLITNNTQCIQLPISNSVFLSESLSKNLEMNISSFCGMSNCVSYLSITDGGITNNSSSGHYLSNHIPIWTHMGKSYLNSNNFMSAVECFKPDLYCLLADNNTNIASSKKRISKAVDNTINFLKSCIDKHRNTAALKNSNIVASVQGGYCLESRQRCINNILKFNDFFSGFVIGGLQDNTLKTDNIPFDTIEPLIKYVVNKLPTDKFRIIEGIWNPVYIIKFVQLGIDIFDTSYLNNLVDRFTALTFDFNNCGELIEMDFEINLKNEQHVNDFSPILKDCKCLTCTKYTRSYIQHLLNVQEMLGPVLLSIHNLHHYFEFFKKIRQCITENSLDDLENHVKYQYDLHFNQQQIKT